MTDYTPNNDFSVKDSLAPSDPEKLILGSDLDSELEEIATAIASKYDDSNLASEAQALAAVDNTTLMTPLRTAQLVGLSGSGGGTANALPDIRALNDPGDDRILFWDESTDSITFLDIGTALETTAGAVLNVVPASVDHDALLNFVANEHIDHTSVTITAGVGLSYSVGGTDISADATIDLDINELTTESTLDVVNDTLPFYDNSAMAVRKVELNQLVGDELGDGKFYRNATQAINTTEATLVFNTTDYNNLTKGTFNTTTGEYTNGSAASRVLVSAYARISALDAGRSVDFIIEVDGVEQARGLAQAINGSGAVDTVVTVTSALSLAASDVVTIRIRIDAGSESTAAGLANTAVSIVELA